jgi:hypothetical protein
MNSGNQIVCPSDNQAALVNPGMGWTHFHYSNSLANYGSKLAPSDTVDDFPGLAVCYLRLPWSCIEPREGEFDWSVVDAPAQRWISKGKRVAFRFTACESGFQWGAPRWVRDAGAKGSHFRRGSVTDDPSDCWEPDYGDPVFLRKLEAFIAAAAARYDGDPTVEWIDVGSVGIWGERPHLLEHQEAVWRRHVHPAHGPSPEAFPPDAAGSQ